MKNIIDELCKMNTVDITKCVAEFINKYCKDHAKVKVNDNGDTTLKVTLTGEEIKYILTHEFNT